MRPERKYWRFSGKYWQYQLIGFSIVFAGEVIAGIGVSQFTFVLLLRLIVSYSIFFGLFSVMRLLYRQVYRRAESPLVYLVASVIASLLCSSLFIELREFFRVFVFQVADDWLLRERNWTYLTSVIQNIWVPFAWSLLYFGIKYWQDSVEERERAIEAVGMAQKAQLQMLRYQLNPHFLFNSLNSIQALVHENPDQADEMVSELSEFLRYTLKYNDKITIPIHEEIEINRRYLTIEKVRYEDRLDFLLEAAPNVLGIEIPCFITQPLVENSIKHGLFNNPLGIRISLNVMYENGILSLEVANTGNLTSDWQKGVGLKNVIERLENSHPGNFDFSLSQQDGLVIAKISITLNYE